MLLKKFPSYLLAIVVGIIAVSIQWVIAHQLQFSATGLLYPGIFFIAWYIGLGQALVTALVSTLGAAYVLYPPYDSILVDNPQDIIRLLIFFTTSSVTAFVVVRGTKYHQKSAMIEERFRRSANAINLGVWYCDLPFSDLIWDKTVKEHFWLPEDAQVTIETFYERIHPDDRNRTRLAIEHSIQNHASYDIIYRTTNPKDVSQVKHIRAIGWTDYDKDGNPIRFDGITFDNSHMQKVSSDLEESLEVLETINRVGRSISAELDTKVLVQNVTDAATQLSKAEFGAFFYNLINEKGESYTLYTISGVPIEKFNKFPMPRNTAVFAPTFAGEGIVRSDDITKDPRYGKNDPYFGKPQGHLPVVSYLAVPVVSRSGEVIGGLFLGHKERAKFTEREEKLVAGLASQIAVAMDNARLFDKVRESLRLRDEFLSISSHELKTPLTSLKMQLQLFAHILHNDKGPVPEERVKKIVEVSERQVNRLNSLVEDLLDVSRIQSGKLSLYKEAVDLSDLVREIAERYSPLMRQSNCTLDYAVPPKLVVKVDRIRFEQVLINLVSNAMKYAPGSHVMIRLEEFAGEMKITVKDNGPGIPASAHERIFNRFESVNARDGKGLGLGLYIVRQIVEAHEGTIHLSSQPGQGAEFTISLPNT